MLVMHYLAPNLFVHLGEKFYATIQSHFATSYAQFCIKDINLLRQKIWVFNIPVVNHCVVAKQMEISLPSDQLKVQNVLVTITFNMFTMQSNLWKLLLQNYMHIISDKFMNV